jgi:3-hydroxyisobutyrate dehydrogenase-like beta-hydroxyacid dehydrogenase
VTGPRTPLGRMGSPMARLLLRAGFPLTAGKRAAPRELLPADGGVAVVESPAEDDERREAVS